MAGPAVARTANPPRPDRGLAPRDRLARVIQAGRAHRRHSVHYSRFVSLLKVVLPAVAVSLAALVLLWPQISPSNLRFRIAPVQVNAEDLENLRMTNPRLLGRDERNQPYTVTADNAEQATAASVATDLVNPKGDISLTDGTWIAISAESGRFDKAQQVLELSGSVNVFQDQGYELHTTRATVNLARGSAAGDAPVVGHGPGAELRGQGFRIENKGETISVTGQSRLLLFPDAPGKR